MTESTGRAERIKLERLSTLTPLANLMAGLTEHAFTFVCCVMLSAISLRQGAAADLGDKSNWKFVASPIHDPSSRTAHPVYHGVCVARWARLILDCRVCIADALEMHMKVCKLDYYVKPSFYRLS